jgi:hypothetical protein
MILFTPEISETTIAFPEDIASSEAFGSPSFNEGNINTYYADFMSIFC